jgi:tellurite resistance protein
MAIKVTDLRHVGAERLGNAVQQMIERQSAGPTSRHRLPGKDQLRAGAESTRGGADDQQARTFQSILELGYLVASADGFAEEERKALAALLEQATGAAVNREEMELHFKDLDEAVAMLGRRERLRRAAAEFDDALGRTYAVTFTALIAVADGELGQPEIEALAELGSCFELPVTEVLEIVEGVARELERTLEGS